MSHDPNVDSGINFLLKLFAVIMLVLIFSICKSCWNYYHRTPSTVQIISSDSTQLNEKQFIVNRIAKRPITIKLITATGFSSGVAKVENAFMMVSTNGDTAYCDIRYTYVPEKNEKISVREMTGTIYNDTINQSIWMQVSKIKPEHNSTGFHGF